jgi:hypothetical protein
MGEKEFFNPLTGEVETTGEDGKLTDGVAAYGFGISVNIFGLPFHWDWVKRWDFRTPSAHRDLLLDFGSSSRIFTVR